MLTNANLSTAVSEAGTHLQHRGRHGQPGGHAAVPHRRLRLGAVRHVAGRPFRDPAGRRSERPARADRHRAHHRDVRGPGGADGAAGHARRLRHTDLSSLRHIFYGASPISEDVLVGAWTTFGCGFYQVYGMTETTGAITALRPRTTIPTVRGEAPALGRQAPHLGRAARRRPGQRAGRGAGAGRGGVDAVALQHGGLLAEAGRDGGDHATPRAGSGPATPDTSTPRATCTCTTGSRT